MEAISQAVRDVRGLRAEIRADTFAFQERHDKGLSETRELVSKNAQNISALIAQAQLANQRIGELTLKTDKLSLRISKQ